MFAEVVPVFGPVRRRRSGAVSNNGSGDGTHQRRQLGGGNGALLQQLSLRRISRKGAAPAVGCSLAAASGRRRSRRRVGTLCQGIENGRRSDSGGWVAARSRPCDVRSAL